MLFDVLTIILRSQIRCVKDSVYPPKPHPDPSCSQFKQVTLIKYHRLIAKPEQVYFDLCRYPGFNLVSAKSDLAGLNIYLLFDRKANRLACNGTVSGRCIKLLYPRNFRSFPRWIKHNLIANIQNSRLDVSSYYTPIIAMLKKRQEG